MTLEERLKAEVERLHGMKGTVRSIYALRVLRNVFGPLPGEQDYEPPLSQPIRILTSAVCRFCTGRRLYPHPGVGLECLDCGAVELETLVRCEHCERVQDKLIFLHKPTGEWHCPQCHQKDKP